jgi:hypothetical protein
MPNVRASRWGNLDALKGKNRAEMAAAILTSLPTDRAIAIGKTAIVRIHVSGDFFSADYLGAWIDVAAARPGVLFYAYTKSLRHWILLRDSIPANLILTASYGGKDDDLIARHNLRSARVVFSSQEAADMALPIDHDDSHAMSADGESFAILLHGVQPIGTPASKALSALRASGEFGYGDLADKRRLVALAMAE